MTVCVVETSKLARRHGRQVAVDRVDLTVRRGEVYGLLGPDGAGKTTTLRILLGLVKPSGGRVRVLGLEPGSPAALAHIGTLVGSAAFYPHLSGRDNLRAFARYCRVRDARADVVLEIVGLSDRAGERYSAYTRDTRQRLGIAAALLKDPELLILDEPTRGLDRPGTADIRVLLRQLGRDGRTVLLSSHLRDEVRQVCDRVGMISGGRLVRAGPVDGMRGAAVLTVRAEPLDRARAVAETMFGPDQVTVCENELRVSAEPDDAVRINRELVLAGIAVHRLFEVT